MTISSCSNLFCNLNNLGYTATEFDGEITFSVLYNYDILCIGTPNENYGTSFTESEIDAIVKFVSNGGGLMISGDYCKSTITTNERINSISNNFGIHFNQDSRTPMWPEITGFTPHEINNGINSVGYYAWCSTTLSENCTCIAHYNSTCVAEVCEYGKGRVFSLHDWNIYSNSYSSEYDNLAWVTQGIDWTAGGTGKTYPVADIKANNKDGPVQITTDENVKITISLLAGNKAGQIADWWVAYNTSGAWYTFVYPSLNWLSGVNLCAQAGLFDLAPYEVLNTTMPEGTYTFYFAVDYPDGAAAGPWWGMDSLVVTVQSQDLTVKTSTILMDEQFDFSEGKVVSSGGDMTYVNFPKGTYTGSSVTEGVSGNYGEDYDDFLNFISELTFLPGSGKWYTYEGVYCFDGSFDTRGKCTRWVKTLEGEYACLFVESADETSLTIKWVYPYTVK